MESKGDAASAPEGGAAAPAPAGGGGIVAQAKEAEAGFSEQLCKYRERVQKEGTPLRQVIKAGRESINTAMAGVVAYKDGISERFGEITSTAAAHTNMTLSKVGLDVDVSSASELCEKHPALVVGVATTVVAVPSLLFGKRAALRNGVLVAATASTVTYAVSHWQQIKQQAK